LTVTRIQLEYSSPDNTLHSDIRPPATHALVQTSPRNQKVTMQNDKDGGVEEFSDEKLQEIYLFALDLGRRAGKILQDGIDLRTRGENEQEMVEKVNAVDIVTQTDLGECVFRFASRKSFLMLEAHERTTRLQGGELDVGEDCVPIVFAVM
jgi:hypothetical protein